MRKVMRRLLQAAGLLALAGIAAAAVAFFSLAGILQVEEKIERADYILPLAGDWHRIVRAAELYGDGVAPRVFLSQEYEPPPTRIHEIIVGMGVPRIEQREFLPKLLAHLGVPGTSVEPFGDGHVSTVEEAEALRRHIGARRMTIVLVTSPYHSRRALLAFRRTLPNVRLLIATTPEGRLPERWWADRDAALLAVPEAAKLAHYFLGGAFRSGGQK